MSDAPKHEFTEAYAADVRKRFENLEKQVKELVEFAKPLGHLPSK